MLTIVAAPDSANLFGVDLTGIELRADDLEWSAGSGEVLIGPAQVLTLVACGRRLPLARLVDDETGRFTRALRPRNRRSASWC